jgi:hypothetical protein
LIFLFVFSKHLRVWLFFLVFQVHTSFVPKNWLKFNFLPASPLHSKETNELYRTDYKISRNEEL